MALAAIDSAGAARRRQTVVGLTLATLVIGAFLALHIGAVFLVPWEGLAPPVRYGFGAAAVAGLTWLSVGLFIVAHDCMHGSLAPGRPAVNRAFGRLTLFLYAGFSYDKLLPEHHKHHRRSGTADDPDFNADNPSDFVPWFWRFMRHYFGFREWLVLTLMMTVYVLVFRAPVTNVLVFYALPAVISAVQLFYFGTFRPHRHDANAFADEHNTRTDDFPFLVSLLTCFHFGYHHEHHLSPTTPWWRLPAYKASRAASVPPCPSRSIS